MKIDRMWISGEIQERHARIESNGLEMFDGNDCFGDALVNEKSSEDEVWGVASNVQYFLDGYRGSKSEIHEIYETIVRICQ